MVFKKLKKKSYEQMKTEKCAKFIRNWVLFTFFLLPLIPSEVVFNIIKHIQPHSTIKFQIMSLL